jgi:hypothetical protein
MSYRTKIKADGKGNDNVSVPLARRYANLKIGREILVSELLQGSICEIEGEPRLTETARREKRFRGRCRQRGGEIEFIWEFV